MNRPPCCPQIDVAAWLVHKLRQRGVDVTSAFWAQLSAEEPWYLYIASKDVEGNGARATYTAILETVRRKREFRIDPFDIKAIPPGDTICRDADRGTIEVVRIDVRQAGGSLTLAERLLAERNWLFELLVRERYEVATPGAVRSVLDDLRERGFVRIEILEAMEEHDGDFGA